MWSTQMWALCSPACALVDAESRAGDCDTLANPGASEAATFCRRAVAVDRDQGGAITRIAGTGCEAIARDNVNRRHSNNVRGDTITFGCAAGRWVGVGTAPNVECICES